MQSIIQYLSNKKQRHSTDQHITIKLSRQTNRYIEKEAEKSSVCEDVQKLSDVHFCLWFVKLPFPPQDFFLSDRHHSQFHT